MSSVEGSWYPREREDIFLKILGHSFGPEVRQALQLSKEAAVSGFQKPELTGYEFQLSATKMISPF